MSQAAIAKRALSPQTKAILLAATIPVVVAIYAHTGFTGPTVKIGK